MGFVCVCVCVGGGTIIIIIIIITATKVNEFIWSPSLEYIMVTAGPQVNGTTHGNVDVFKWPANRPNEKFDLVKSVTAHAGQCQTLHIDKSQR